MNKPSKKVYRTLQLSDVETLDICLTKEQADNGKRQLRKPLLKAFDTHKTAVIYEGKAETQDERNSVLAWKQGLLDLQTEAFKSVPEKVKYYL